MRTFSWYTIIHPDWNKGEPPLFRLVGPAILPDERTYDHYRPDMKWGHTHNHIFNKVNKHLFRSKTNRRIDRRRKPEFVKTAMCNIWLGRIDFDSLLHIIFHHNKKQEILK